MGHARGLIEALRAESERQMERTFEARGGCDTARAKAERGRAVSAEAVARMEAARVAAVDIGKAVDLIEELAFQTNIIALNTGIEAAHHGASTSGANGFAVLAGEVQALAARSAEAVGAIRERGRAAREAVKAGAALVAESSEALDEILKAAVASEAQVRQAADASAAQIETLGEVDRAVTDIERKAGRNLEMVSETGAASLDLLGRAERTSALVDRFMLGDEAARAAA